MRNPHERIYNINESIVFQKNNEPYGELSNMVAFPLVVNGVGIRTVEALYQACKYPAYPDSQREIIEQKSPMGAKFKSRSFSGRVRADWDNVKVKIMRWCLRVKLVQHWDNFGWVLLSTSNKPIVERSKVDSYWGARPQTKKTLIGQNVLGRLLMELRQELQSKDRERLRTVEPLDIKNFLLYMKPIEKVIYVPDSIESQNDMDEDQATQLELPY